MTRTSECLLIPLPYKSEYNYRPLTIHFPWLGHWKDAVHYKKKKEAYLVKQHNVLKMVSKTKYTYLFRRQCKVCNRNYKQNKFLQLTRSSLPVRVPKIYLHSLQEEREPFYSKQSTASTFKPLTHWYFQQIDKFCSRSKQTLLVGHSWGSPGRLWCLDTRYEAALHLWKTHIGLCSTLCVQIGFLFKLLQQTVAEPPCKVVSNKTAQLWCHMGISYRALQALQRMLHKEIKESASGWDSTPGNVKGRFQPTVLVKQECNQRSEIHVRCFKGPSNALVICLGERQVTRIPRAFPSVQVPAFAVLSQTWWLVCEQSLHHQTHPGSLATGNPWRKA